MASPIEGSQPPAQQTDAAQVSQQNQNAATQAQVSSSTKVSNMTQLKEKAPEIYDSLLKGIAMSMVTQLQRNQERLKKMMEKERRENGG